MIESDAVQLLLNDVEVVAMIGVRLFPNIAPQGTAAPYVVYYSMQAGVGCFGGTSMRSATMTFQCWAERYGQARELADKVHAALSSLMPGSANTIDGYDQGAKLHRVILTESFWK